MGQSRKTLVAVATLCSAISFPVIAETAWDVSLWSKRRAFTEHVEKISELVSKKTDGEFKLNISYGGLSKNKENLDGIAVGAFEMAQICAFYHKDKNPTLTVLELPFVKDLTLGQIASISQKIYQHPIVKKDLAKWDATILMPSPLPQYNLVGTGSMPVELEDFSGKRLRGPGGVTDVLAAYGTVKTGLAANEVRQALDSGVVDTVAFAPHAHLAFGSVDAGKWRTENLNLGTGECPVVVNTEALNSLSPEHKEALLSSVDEAVGYYVENYETNVVKKYNDKINDKGLKTLTFNDKQVTAFEKTAKEVREKWVADNSKKFDAKTLMTVMEDLVAEAAK